MDWNSRHATAILQNALMEDKATRDATTYACIDPHQQALAAILAKQGCVIAGLGAIERIFEVFAALDGAVTTIADVTSSPEVFDGVHLRRGDTVAIIQHNA